MLIDITPLDIAAISAALPSVRLLPALALSSYAAFEHFWGRVSSSAISVCSSMRSNP